MSEYSATDTDRRLGNVVSIGRIMAVNPAQGLVQVDLGGPTTDWIPWTTTRAGGDRTYWCPEVGEQVVVAAPSGELGNAVVLGSMFQDAYPEAADSADVNRTVYANGTTIEHDRATGAYLLDVPAGGSITLRCGASSLVISDAGIVLNGPRIDLN